MQQVHLRGISTTKMLIRAPNCAPLCTNCGDCEEQCLILVLEFNRLNWRWYNTHGPTQFSGIPLRENGNDSSWAEPEPSQILSRVHKKFLRIMSKFSLGFPCWIWRWAWQLWSLVSPWPSAPFCSSVYSCCRTSCSPSSSCSSSSSSPSSPRALVSF